VTETLLESELFGHAKGSFTGAYRDKMGKLQMAHRGTLFLDEVGEMSLRMQALLLRFLENGEIQPVGADVPTAVVDVRVICATNRRLTEMIATGQFREDLFYRLNIIHLHVPPLREHVEDIQPLVTQFLAKSGRRITLTAEAWRTLERYAWPGNVRQLQNISEQMLWRSSAAETAIEAGELPAVVCTAGQSIIPVGERRRQLCDDLYDAIVKGGYSFWEHIHPLFLDRDLTRHDLRMLVSIGLSASHGNYRTLVASLGMPASDYKRFMNFLATHDCRIDYREFRHANGPGPRPVRSIGSILPPLKERGVDNPSEADQARRIAS
jgi:DNA-binding NtrC family response regulator